MSSKSYKTGAQIVVESLERHGVTHVFGIPGAKIDKVFDTLKSSSIETVVCRHEQNAAFIAGGIGRLTGKAGVAIATSGPGVSNLTTGLATANRASSRFIRPCRLSRSLHLSRSFAPKQGLRNQLAKSLRMLSGQRSQIVQGQHL